MTLSDLPTTTPVTCRELTRTYDGVAALRGVSFDVRRGEIFGILGENGAGKTTLVKILATLLTPTSGDACVEGFDVTREGQAVRRVIGFVLGGDRGLYPRLSATENLRYFAALAGLGRRDGENRIAAMLKRVGLEEAKDRRVEGYSRGMKQRLHLARGLLPRPSTLLLDEPTIGLDPLGSRSMRDLVREARDGGATILLTSHYMAEVDELCDRVVILHRGNVAFEGTPRAVKQLMPTGSLIEFEISGFDEWQHDKLKQLPGVVRSTINDSGGLWIVTVHSTDASGLLPKLLETVQRGGGRVAALTVRQPSLEEAYVSYVATLR